MEVKALLAACEKVRADGRRGGKPEQTTVQAPYVQGTLKLPLHPKKQVKKRKKKKAASDGDSYLSLKVADEYEPVTPLSKRREQECVCVRGCRCVYARVCV